MSPLYRMVMFSNNVEPANGFLVRYLHRKLMEAEEPRSVKNEDLLRVLDWVPRLWYHLHTFLEKHSTSDFLIGNVHYYIGTKLDENEEAFFNNKLDALNSGSVSSVCPIGVAVGPCFFLSCPVTVEEFRTWFIDLWNLSIIPYLQEGAKDGIKVGQSIPNLKINLTCRSGCHFLSFSSGQFLGWMQDLFLFVRYTIIQNVTSSEM